MKPGGIRDSRAWASLDVGYFDNPKVVDALDASSTAVCMHIASILYCAQHLTDGHAPVKMLQRKTGGTADDVALICDAGLWHEPGHDCPECPQPAEGRVYVHNFLEHNRSEAEANAASERARRAANVKHGKEPAPGSASRTASRTASGSATRTASSTADSSADRTADGMRSGMHRQTDRQTPSPTERETTPALVLADAPTPRSQDRFDEFWATYPRKEGKAKARTKFAAACKRADPQTVIGGAARYRNDPNREAAFTAHATTWLERDGWEDEPLPPRATGSSRIDGNRARIIQHAQQAPAPRQEELDPWAPIRLKEVGA